MALQLNEPRTEYQAFFGRYIDQMPVLISEGRRPMSVADIMRRRLEVANSTPDVRAAWMDNFFDTSDGIAYHSNGEAKIVLDSTALRTITAQDTFTHGALGIDAATYDALPGKEIRTVSLTTATPLTKRAVMNSPIWNALARDDKALLREYTNLVFADAKQRFGYERNMGIFLSPTPATPYLLAWFVNRIDNRSELNASCGLDSNSTRLVGVAPETAARASAGELDEHVRAALREKKAFEYDRTIYAPLDAPNITVQ